MSVVLFSLLALSPAYPHQSDVAALFGVLLCRATAHHSTLHVYSQKPALKTGAVGQLGKFCTDSVLSYCYYKLVGIKSKNVSERKA